MRALGSRPQRTDWGPPALVGHGAADCGPYLAVAGPQRSLSLSLAGRCGPIRPPADPHMTANRSQHGHPTLNASGWPSFPSICRRGSFGGRLAAQSRPPLGSICPQLDQPWPGTGHRSSVLNASAEAPIVRAPGRVAGSEPDLLSRASFTSTPQSCPMGRKENRRAPLKRRQRGPSWRRSSPATMRLRRYARGLRDAPTCAACEGEGSRVPASASGLIRC